MVLKKAKKTGRERSGKSKDRDGVVLRHRFVDTALGRLVYVFRGDLLAHCSFPEKSAATMRSQLFEFLYESREDKNLRPDLARRLVTYFSGKNVEFDVALVTDHLTPFFVRIYDELRRVGFGELITYGELARRAGSPGAGRSVGVALRMSTFGPVVPTHRVIASDGSLGGFASSEGLAAKRTLLVLEGHKIGKKRIAADDRALLASFRGM